MILGGMMKKLKKIFIKKIINYFNKYLINIQNK